MTCEAALKRVIHAAEAITLEPSASATGVAWSASEPPRDPAGHDEAEAAAQRSSRSRAALARRIFERAIEGLEPEVAQKLRVLAIAGRNAVGIANARAQLRASAARAPLADVAGAHLLARSLRGGHAVALATALDLESPLTAWGSGVPRTLEERAWLTFGKQLAKCDPTAWQCMVLMVPADSGASRLLLKRQEHDWWSFGSVLDRPSGSAVDKDARAFRGKRSTGTGLQMLCALPQLPNAGGPALRRAVRAIRARTG